MPGPVGVGGSFIQIAFLGGDYPGMPFFVVRGLSAVVAGLLMIAIFILWARISPEGWSSFRRQHAELARCQ